jgi:hypothetical protein
VFIVSLLVGGGWCDSSENAMAERSALPQR